MVREVIFYHNINQSQLAEKLGCNQSYISDVKRGKKPVSDKIMENLRKIWEEVKADNATINSEDSTMKQRMNEFLKKISEVYPMLNIAWLKTGVGSMLNQTEPSQQTATKQTPITAESLDFITAGGEAFSSMLVRMMNEKQIAPYGLLADKDKEIVELNREIGKLEALLEVAKKGTARQADNATVADVG